MVASTPDNGQTPTGTLSTSPLRSADGPLNGDDIFTVFAAAAQHLRESAAAVDAINVYPVPDGDTGSNMSATLREAVDSVRVLPSPRAAHQVLEQLAKGALYGARGNSGVILSQALTGLAKGAGDIPGGLDAASLANGLQEAAIAAYRAVSHPVEGTMLTVLREAGVAASVAARDLPQGGAGQPCLPVLKAAARGAEEAEARTIDELPKLREAGVTDAGGEGICVILRGLLAALTGEAPPAPAMPERPIAQLAGHADEQFGYCIEFVLEPRAGLLDPDAVRHWAEAGSNRSIVVVGGGEAVRVHVHADDGAALLTAAETLGRVSRAKVDDMGAQHGRWRATGSGAVQPIAVLALSRGRGIDGLFESIGAKVADLGHVIKPPAGDIAGAADAVGAADVIVLANHKDVVMAARQAAALARCTLHVLETTSLPQGIAAGLAFDGSAGVAANLERMREAAAGVVTIEVTDAVNDRTVEGVAVRAGQAIALVDGKLRLARDTAVEALVDAVRLAEAPAGSLITLYCGEGASPGIRSEAMRELGLAFPAAEIERHDGEQPLYTFVASIER